jgi:hypothetical protein
MVQLFRAPDIEDRDVGLMASAMGLERGIVQYHLDCLAEAEMAETTGGNYLHGHVYWALTPKGRRYVVEQKLIS